MGGQCCHGANIVPARFCSDGDKGASWTKCSYLHVKLNHDQQSLETLLDAEYATDKMHFSCIIEKRKRTMNLLLHSSQLPRDHMRSTSPAVSALSMNDDPLVKLPGWKYTYCPLYWINSCLGTDQPSQVFLTHIKHLWISKN